MSLRFLLTIIGTIIFASSSAQEDELAPSEFRKLMVEDKGEVVIIDVRTEEECKSGVIGKPFKIDYFQNDFNEKVKRLDKSKTYLVYCASGYRSGETVRFMKKNGFKKAYNLKGGFSKWKREKMPIQN